MWHSGGKMLDCAERVMELSDKLAFNHRVDGWILAAIVRGVTGFDDLIVALPSVYPSHALGAMHRLVAEGEIVPEVLERAIRDITRETGARLGTSGPARLPIPHPLDYDC